MSRRMAITHEFVEYVPDDPEEGKVYVSVTFATAVHRCCCGCGYLVVTPLSPTDWKMTFDGVSVSLAPSIGNWDFPCRSHYWITGDRVRWSGDWSRGEVDAERKRDASAKRAYYESREGADVAESASSNQEAPKPTLWQALKKWLFK